ncbi:BON domain-containing protein [Crenobacter sp. SG2303]|uniref:BON domain-containing protein n=1 Tax=Crenobacter oryzisoli TaxID=3056844 RepID=A0ABT7XKL0_9NEIS|nr:BON domain-containing protein [Crenobacter sp. SG2303]MDN0074310.1 BON domain-containing protein [Crenobacter sp. SG2303]
MQNSLILAALLSLSATAVLAGPVTDVQPLAQPQHLAAAGESKDARLAKVVERTVKPQAERLGAQVSLTVKDGQVVLDGVAPSEDVIRQLVELASTVKGVSQVSSEIEVKPV